MKTLSTLFLAASIAFPAFAQAADQVITAPPAGATKTLFSRNSVGLQMDMFAGFDNFELYGWAQEIYEDGDDVYMANPVCPFLYDTYIKGKKTALGYSFPMPQPIYYYDQNGTQEMFLVDMFYLDPTDGEYFRDTTEGRSYDLEKQANGQYKFDYLGFHVQSSSWGSYYFTDRLLGVCESSTGEWLGFSELTCRLIPFDSTLLTPPANLATKQYQFTYGVNGCMVELGFDGDDAYLKGILSEQPETWIKGKKNGNNVTFPSGQYIGIADGLTIFFAGAQIQEGEYGDQTAVVSDSFTMTYDAASDSYASDEAIQLCAGPELDEEYVTFYACEFRPVPENVNPTPSAPQFVDFMNFDNDLEFGRIRFSIVGLNAEGDVLNWDRLSYALFIDDEIYSLDPADYTRLEDEMIWVPADFADNWDILVYPQGVRSVYFYANVEDNIAVQVRYLDDNGVFHYSKKLVVNADGSLGEDDAVKSLFNSNDIVGRERVDLLGRRSAKDAKGFGIDICRMADGTYRAVKSVNK